MPLTLEKIEALALDHVSLAGLRQLLKQAGWLTLPAADGLAWGECQGTAATSYRVVVSDAVAVAGYKCTCPSRRFSCKHSLAPIWMRAEGKLASTPAPFPEWVKDWFAADTDRDSHLPPATPSLAQAVSRSSPDFSRILSRGLHSGRARRSRRLAEG